MVDGKITIIGSTEDNCDGIVSAKNKIFEIFGPLFGLSEEGCVKSKIEITTPHDIIKRSEWSYNLWASWIRDIQESNFIVLVRNCDGEIPKEAYFDIILAKENNIPIIEFYEIDNKKED